MLIPPKIQLPKLPTPLHLPLHPVLTAFQPEHWHQLLASCTGIRMSHPWRREAVGVVGGVVWFALCICPWDFFQKFATSAL